MTDHKFLINVLSASDENLSNMLSTKYPDKEWTGYSDPDDMTITIASTDDKKPGIVAQAQTTADENNAKLSYLIDVGKTQVKRTVTVVPQPKYWQLRQEVAKLMQLDLLRLAASKY